MSELLKKYESIDQSKLSEATIKILNRVKTITSDFTADDAKNNDIAEKVMNEILKKNPDAVKIVKREPKAKLAPKKTHKAKGTHKAKATHKATLAPATKTSNNNIMSVAKEIQKTGESWKDAMERAKQVLKERKEQNVQKSRTEMEKLLALVRTKKELQGFANSDIKRDSVRDAKPRGARFVTKEGTTTNQYGTYDNKLGRKYWETRDRHADRLAPNYPKDMPLLAKGGVLPDEYVRTVRWADGNYRVEKKTKQNDFGHTFNDVFEDVVKAESFAKKIAENNHVDYVGVNTTPYDFVKLKSLKRNKMANGGSFAPSVSDGTAFMDNAYFAKGGAFKGFKFNVGDKVMVNTDLDFLNKFYKYEIPPTFEMGYDFTKPVTIVSVMVNSKNKPFYGLRTAPTENSPNGYLVNSDLPEALLSPATSSNKDSDVKIKDWYTKTYPTDDLGEELNDSVTFEDLWNEDYKKYNIYQVMGVGDSLIRERLFERLAEIKGVGYDVVYKKLFSSDGFYADGGSFAPNVADGTQFMDGVYADGGSVANERMFNFLKDDLGKLEKANNEGDYEEVGRFFSYWLGSSGHLKSLKTEKNDRMYNFLKDDLEKLENSINDGEQEQVDMFFSYWGQHLDSLKMTNGGVFASDNSAYLTDPTFGDFQNSGMFDDGGSLITETVSAIFNPNQKRGKIETGFGSKTKEGLFAMMTNVNYSPEEITTAVFLPNAKKGRIYTEFGAKTKEGLHEMVEDMRNTFEHGGSMASLTEQEFLKKYFGANVFAENPSQYFEIKKMSSDNDAKVNAFVKELKADGFTVKKRAYSDFTSVMGVKKKASFANGGAFVMTDLAGHTGGSDGLGNPMPLGGVSGTHYTGLVGETGAMSSGELFENGGGIEKRLYGIEKNYQPYDFKLYTYQEAKVKAQEYMKEDPRSVFEPRLYNDMRSELPAIERMNMPKLDKNGNLEDVDRTPFSKGDLADYEAGGAMMQNQQVINDASQPYVITEAFGNPAQQIGMLAKGGSIPNNYEGKYYGDIWDNEWTNEQKHHFLSDHKNEIGFEEILNLESPLKRATKRLKTSQGSDGGFQLINAEKLVNTKSSELPRYVKFSFQKHIREGQYASGGSLGKALYVAYSSYFDYNKYDEEKIISTLKSIGAKNIRLENESGMSNQPEVVVFNGSKNQATDALNEAFDTDYIMVYEKDWRTKKMADGGSFAPNVADGTQFMNGVYADGGSINGMLNKKMQKLAEKKGLTMDALGRDEFNKAMTQALVESLTDANFHDEAKQVVIKAEGKTKWSDELYQSESFNPDAEVASFAREVSRTCEWDGDDILNAYYFITKMQGSKVAGMIDDLFLNPKPTQSSSKPTKYIDHDDIESVTLNVNGNFVTFAGKDFLNGANLMEKGGDLSKIATYFPKRDIVKVTLKNGDTIKPLNGYWLKKGSEPMGKKTTSTPPKTGKVTSPNYPDVNFNHKVVINGRTIHLALAKSYKTGLDDSKQYDFIDVDGNPMTGYGYSVKEALKQIEEYGNDPIYSSKNTPPKIDETKAHFKMDIASGGKFEVFVDSNFVNQSQNNLPNTELKHYGFGDFYLQTPDGNIDFIRTSEEKQGFVGRTHKMKGSDELVLKLVDAMKEKGRFESTQTFANGGSFAPNVADGTQFMNGVYANGGGVSRKLENGVYRVGKPTKVSANLYEQKIVEIFDNGDISTASDYGRKLSDFKSQKYPIITKEQLDAQYKMADGGSTGSGFDPVKVKVVMAVGLDRAIEFYDAEYPIRPYQLLERAVKGGYITLDEINEGVVDSAMETAQDSEDMDEVGSSDFGAYLRDFLDEAGFKVGYVNGRLTREFADGGFFTPNVSDGTAFMDNAYFANGGEVRRFNRHEQMDSETREEVLDVVSEPQLNGSLTNYLYGLYDGYDYSETENFKKEMSKLKSKDLAMYDRINAIYRKIDKYKFEQYDDFANVGRNCGDLEKSESLKYFILNEASSGMIANKTPYSDYKSIDRIRLTAIQILNRDGDRRYSVKAFSDLIQEALEEDNENEAELHYANGGGIGARHLVGEFNEQQLRKGEDKIAIEKAQKQTGLTYIQSKVIKKAGKPFMQVYLISNEEYLKSSEFANGGGVSSYQVMIDGDWDEPKNFKTFSLAKKWIYENIKNHDSLELVDSYGDSIYVDGKDTKQDLDWLFSNREASFANGGSFAPNVADGTQFMNEVYADGGKVKNKEIISSESFIVKEKSNYDNAIDELIPLINKSLSDKGLSEITTNDEFDKYDDFPNRVYVDNDTMIRIWDTKQSKNGVQFNVSVFKEESYANGGSFVPNVANGTQFMNGVYADGGEMQGNNIDAELEDFDLDELDPFETMQYNNFVKSLGKVGALQVLINTVEGDYSQLSPALAELAEMQMSTEEYDEATRQMRFERDGYAKGGSLDSVEKSEIRTFVNSLFNRAKNKISNDKGNSLFVVSSTINATQGSLGNPTFYLGVKKVQNSRPTYVVGSGFLSSDMLVYESYKKDSRFLETESVVEAKKFLTEKVKRQILHLKDKGVFADGGMFDDNDGFMRADNERSFRYPEREVRVDSISDSVDLTNDISYKPNEVVIRTLDENIDLNDDNRIRARMGSNPMNRNPNKMMAVNPRMIFTDLPKPTSSTHKND
jgi:hypothetical protein